MNVGILTLPLNENYGGILQAYALQKFLKDRGHIVSHIELTNKKSLIYKNPLRVKLWYLVKLSLNMGKDSRGELRKIYELNAHASEIRKFVATHINRLFYDDLKCYKKDGFEILVVGSDQIWRPKYYNQIEDAFLRFALNDSVKKISYAPSFGTEKWTFNDEQTIVCRKLIDQFDAISIREDIGCDFVKEYFHREAEHVIDPTMLLRKEDYIALLANEYNQNSNQLTSYILDMTDEKKKILEAVAKEKELSHFELNLSMLGKKKSIEGWLKGFMEASFIITDSFHGCVFSILFQKPFIAIGNHDRGIGRFTSLLKLFELEDRLIYDMKDFDKIYQSRIEWTKVQTILNEEREKSNLFLKSQGL